MTAEIGPAPTEPLEGTVIGTGDPILDKLFGALNGGGEGASPNLKLLVFGEPGSGKTTLAGTAPSPLYIDVDKGLVSVPKLFQSENHFKYKSVYQLEALIPYLKAGHELFDKFETVVIDTLSKVHKEGLKEVATRHWKEDKDRPNPNVVYGSDHQENNERIRALVNDFIQLDRNIIMNCHVAYAKEKGEEGATTFKMDFSDKLANMVAGDFDLVAYTKQETDMSDNTIVRMTIRSSGSHKVKTRIKTMPNEMINPTWDKIYKRYEEFINSEIKEA